MHAHMSSLKLQPLDILSYLLDVEWDINNNNDIVICKVHKVSSKAESEAPAVARWAALVA